MSSQISLKAISNIKFVRNLIFVTLCLSIINIIFGCFFQPIFILNETHSMYLFSTVAQVIASIFGLTLTAYAFFLDKFKDEARSDSTYYEATNSLIRTHFSMLIIISILCGTRNSESK